MNIAFRIACVFMIGIFAVSCIVQYNDPDPWLWVAFYGLAGVATVLALAGRHSPVVIPMGLAYFGFAMYNMPHIEPGKWLTTETSRESGGLMICAVWMAVLTVVWYRKKHPSPA